MRWIRIEGCKWGALGNVSEVDLAVAVAGGNVFEECKLGGVARFAQGWVDELYVVCRKEEGGCGGGSRSRGCCGSRLPVTPFQQSRSMPNSVTVHGST